jgi:predicted dehydrogenase
MEAVKWGIIGCGDVTVKRVAPAMRSLHNCRLSGVSRKKADALDQCRDQIGADKVYSDWKDMVRDDEIDAVYVATPIYLHKEQAVFAAEHGKHVLCEKPMAMSVEECDLMIDAGKANNVLLSVAYYRHYYPVVKRLKAILEDEIIGRCYLIQIDAHEWFDPSEGDPQYWAKFHKYGGGGPLAAFGCHRLEVLLDLCGEVKDIRGCKNKAVFKDRDIEDTAVAVLNFKKGIMAVLTVTMAAGIKKDSLIMYGTKGTVEVPVLNAGSFSLNIGGEAVTESYPPAANTHLPLIEDFADSILNNKNPLVDGAAGREVNRLIEEIYKR